LSTVTPPTEVVLPSMGEGVHEATLVTWLKKPGDWVQKQEPLLEVSTDKVDTEIVAAQEGYLIATFLQAGEVAQVNQLLAQLSLDPKAQPLTPPTAVASKVPALRPSLVDPSARATPLRSGATASPRGATPASFAGFVRASPLARKWAREYGVELGRIPGTGLHGKITRGDLDRYLQEAQSQRATPAALSDPLLASLATEQREGKEYVEGVEVVRQKMSIIRRKTAEHMVHSVRTSPHVTTTFCIDLHAAGVYKKQHEAECLRIHGGKLTYTAFFLYAATQALKAFPYANASVDGDDLLLKRDINLGCAVAIDTGLIVPVIKRVNDKSVFEIAGALHDVVTRARSKKLKPEDVQGGTFSITNPGLYGSIHSQPILNQPQVAIMSVGAIQEMPTVIEGKIVIRPLCQVGLTFDHRILDGEGGAKFLATVKQTLEGMS
jgi:pyruvate dehydrogenase E2 component (dihydrolipoamide acetyltransferase)